MDGDHVVVVTCCFVVVAFVGSKTGDVKERRLSACQFFGGERTDRALR